MPSPRNGKSVLTTFYINALERFKLLRKKETIKTDDLLKERIKLNKEIKCQTVDDNMKDMINERIRQIEEEIGEDVANENHKVVVETLHELGDGSNLNGSGRKKLWSLLKKKFPKSSHAIPVAKKDGKGNLVTNHKELKKLYLKTFTQRMRNRPMKADLEELKDLKEELFDIRLKLASKKKSEPWTMDDLEKALKKGQGKGSQWLMQ